MDDKYILKKILLFLPIARIRSHNFKIRKRNRESIEKCNKNDDAAQPIYPLLFFTWVENKPVASRALDCIDNFNAYMEWWGKQPPSKKPKNNHSFDTLATH